MAADTSITELTISHLETTLSAALIAAIQADLTQDQNTVVEVLRGGRLQDNPTTGTGIQILLHPNHPIEDHWDHIPTQEEVGLYIPPYEIGGGGLYIRAYTVFFQVFDKGEKDRAVTRRIAYVVASRLCDNLRQALGSTVLEDTFGERVIHPFIITKQKMAEAGGPGMFIHRGEVWFLSLNEIPSQFT